MIVKSSQIPQNNILTAKLSARLNMPTRYLGTIDTGVSVKVQKGYCLRVNLVPELAGKGLIVVSPIRITNGQVSVCVLNGGREIVSINDGDPLVELWAEKIEVITWEQV